MGGSRRAILIPIVTIMPMEHPRLETAMYRKLFALAFLLALQAIPLEVGATDNCAAGNPVANIPLSTPTSAFTDHGDGTVTHALTGLMWKKCAQGLSGPQCGTGAAATMTWSAALAAAVADTTAGHGDWRLPNQKELVSIAEYCGHSPAVNQTLFPATPSLWFHSGTTIVTGPAVNSAVNFDTGQLTAVFKSTPAYVRLVRGGQAIDSFDAQNAPPPPAVLDIDGSVSASKYDALTDGLLVIRYMLGLTGSSLTDGALGGTATRTDPVAIKTYLDGISAVLDIDGNGSTDAMTDGLLILRYLFGLRGSALIDGAVAPLAPRSTAPDVETYIQLLMP